MYIHPTAEVEDGAEVLAGSKVWHVCHIRRGAKVGKDCVLGRGVFVDVGVSLGNSVKVQNYVSIFQGVQLDDGVFVGPHVCFTNDRLPRAVNPELSPKASEDWTVTTTRVQTGASIGANSTIVAGVSVGRWAMVGAGSVVTRDVPDFALVVGNPARQVGFVCACGKRKSSMQGVRDCPGCASHVQA